MSRYRRLKEVFNITKRQMCELKTNLNIPFITWPIVANVWHSKSTGMPSCTTNIAHNRCSKPKWLYAFWHATICSCFEFVLFGAAKHRTNLSNKLVFMVFCMLQALFSMGADSVSIDFEDKSKYLQIFLI